jgi:DnaJ-class molecular chaperone
MCSRCDGSGYIPKYQHIQNGICFKCWGTGSQLIIPAKLQKGTQSYSNFMNQINEQLQIAKHFGNLDEITKLESIIETLK